MNRTARFSKIEIALLVLVWAVVFVLIFGGKNYVTSVRHARESVLKRDLEMMRETIYKYTVDRQQPPESLQTLVDQEYLPMIPTNPITKKADWVPHYVNFDLGGGKVAVGIDDVHASVPYSDW